MKTVAKVMFWIALAFLLGGLVIFCFIIAFPKQILGVVGLLCLLVAIITLSIGVVLFLKDDDKHNLAEPHDDAPKAH